MSGGIPPWFKSPFMYVRRSEDEWDVIRVPFEESLPSTMPGHAARRSMPHHVATCQSREWASYLAELLGDEYHQQLEVAQRVGKRTQ